MVIAGRIGSRQYALDYFRLPREDQDEKRECEGERDRRQCDYLEKECSHVPRFIGDVSIRA